MDVNGIAERVLASQWIAGPGIKDALRVVQHLNEHGIAAMVNYLGEDLTEVSDVKDTVRMYDELIGRMGSGKLGNSISLKITQLGFKINPGLAERNYVHIINKARRRNIFVWLDMESYLTVQPTINLYLKQRSKSGIGICLQAYLKRSMKDLKTIAEAGGTVRLVKGAYTEGNVVAFASRTEVEDNYIGLMNCMFRAMKSFTIATHDAELIGRARKLAKQYKKKPQYAMLNGIRNNLAKELADSGERVALYVPFGPQWVPYAGRRLREFSHLKLVARSMMQSQKIG